MNAVEPSPVAAPTPADDDIPLASSSPLSTKPQDAEALIADVWEHMHPHHRHQASPRQKRRVLFIGIVVCLIMAGLAFYIGTLYQGTIDHQLHNEYYPPPATSALAPQLSSITSLSLITDAM